MLTTKNIVIFGVIVAVLALSVLFAIDSHTGGAAAIEISNIPMGATIFLDNKRAVQAASADSVTLNDLRSGSHTLVVAKDGHWPWGKTLVLESGEHITVRPFLIPQEIKSRVLTDEDEQLKNTITLELSKKSPTKEAPLVSSDKSTALWVDGKTVYAQWNGSQTMPQSFCASGACNPILEVITLEEPIRTAAFYDNRNDVVLFAAKNGIFAIELNKQGTQNFEPLYLGNEPTFAVLPNNILAIQDQDSIYLVSN